MLSLTLMYHILVIGASFALYGSRHNLTDFLTSSTIHHHFLLIFWSSFVSFCSKYNNQPSPALPLHFSHLVLSASSPLPLSVFTLHSLFSLFPYSLRTSLLFSFSNSFLFLNLTLNPHHHHQLHFISSSSCPLFQILHLRTSTSLLCGFHTSAFHFLAPS